MDFSPFANRNVLITGGLGFIGSNLAIRCVALGSRVTILTRSLGKLFNIEQVKDSARIVVVDLSRSANAIAALREAALGQDYVFHLAAQTSHIESMR
ncbi:MAG: NAD-dependent epimerase/dehydratase family protein, partial [Chloroflexi bacterium]|nr:NAD-dependent epimerase/dehydratase family protein [Chloroflexota bacterium]